jgi:hypothetical protein
LSRRGEGGGQGGAGKLGAEAHLVVSIGRVVLEQRDALAVQAPIVPLSLMGQKDGRLSGPAAKLPPSSSPAHPALALSPASLSVLPGPLPSL